MMNRHGVMPPDTTASEATMTQFDVTTSADGDSVRVAVAGECDLAVRDQFSSALLAGVARFPTVIVDLAKVTFLDSSGLDALVAAHREARARNGRVYLVGATGVVADVLELTGVSGLLSPPQGADGG
jgi:anti-anti-sigma factor